MLPLKCLLSHLARALAPAIFMRPKWHFAAIEAFRFTPFCVPRLTVKMKMTSSVPYSSMCFEGTKWMSMELRSVISIDSWCFRVKHKIAAKNEDDFYCMKCQIHSLALINAFFYNAKMYLCIWIVCVMFLSNIYNNLDITKIELTDIQNI